MIKASEIIDVPIQEFESKSTIYIIHDILLNADSTKVIGFFCYKKGLKRNSYILSLKDIASKSYNSILVKSLGVIQYVKEIKKANFGLSYKETILNKIVIDNKGELIGILRDMIFDLTTGYLVSFECYFDDILTGRKLIKAYSGYYFSGGNIIVPYRDLVKEQGRGLVSLNKLRD